MAFTLALYYPWIDITNEDWLKSAVLYWDKIRTVVPESIKTPYSTRTALELHDVGILTPLRVQSDMEEIQSLTDDVVKYLDKPETAEFFLADELRPQMLIHTDKLSMSVQRLASIHPEKLSSEVRYALENSKVLSGQSGGWYEVDARFADFYMTLLATRLSERVGAGLLTDRPTNNKLAISVKLDASLDNQVSQMRKRIREYDAYGQREIAPATLAQGMLVDLILQRIRIAPETPVNKIIKFRRKHADELGRFRSKIDLLTQTVSSDLPIQNLRQKVKDIYHNEVFPSLKDLNKGLRAHGIRWFTENYLKVAFLSTSSTSVIALLGLSVPQALLVSGGISLTASAILYNLDKAQTLSKNPFAYILATEKAFT